MCVWLDMCLPVWFAQDIDGSDQEGNTALLLASCAGHTSIAGLLVERGANVNTANSSGATPLHQSCQRNHHDIARLLLEREANPDATFRSGS